MKTTLGFIGFFTLLLATPAAAQADDPVYKLAQQYCRGMPACQALVQSNDLPARFLVACAQALDRAEPEGPIKVGARSMCNTALEQIRKKAVAQR